MCIITLTRIFQLTHQYPTLVREITTPHLPGFIQAALNSVSTVVKLPSGTSRKAKPNSPLMDTVLRAMLELIPRHPTLFRPFGSQLRSLVAEILSSPPPAYFPEPVVDGAEQLFASIHKCAPKDKSGSGWNEDCRSTILSIHRVADLVFRPVVEQWESVDSTLVPTKQNYSKEVSDEGRDHLGFANWVGTHSGTDRLIMLLRILSAIISMPSSSTISIPLGSILDLVSRLTAVTVPSGGEASQSDVRSNPQIGREEREMLFAELPRIHVASMELLKHVAAVLENATTPLTQNMLEQVTWVFRNERFSRDVRIATYDMLSALVSLNGPAMTKQSVASIANVIRSCCNDLLPESEESNAMKKSYVDSKSKSKNGEATANADSFLTPHLQKHQGSQHELRFPRLQEAASGLLLSVLIFVPSELLTVSVRAEIDRTVILTADKGAMLASVLNPVPAVKGRGAGASILPFLARAYNDQMEVEALVRPRMPVLMTAPELDVETEAEEEDTDQVAVEDYVPAPQTTDFLQEAGTTGNETHAKESFVVPVQKRTYVEETSAPPISLARTSDEQPVQTKRARFNESIPSELPSSAAEQVSATITQASTSVSRPAQVEASNLSKPTSVSTQVSATVFQPHARSSLPDDDSDDELPILNVDPDTEDEDEDITMDG